jgi:hypothetical protein
MGLYLMESLRITRLFPVIGQLDDKMRRRIGWITFGILVVLAGVESSLAFMRDRIAADMQALRQVLADVDATRTSGSIIPTVGQMVMGFILPFALTFVAIPLESFVQSSRTVAGAAAAVSMRWLAFVLRLTGSVAYYAGEFLVNLYDVAIFLPLWLERRLQRSHSRGASPDASRSDPDDETWRDGRAAAGVRGVTGATGVASTAGAGQMGAPRTPTVTANLANLGGSGLATRPLGDPIDDEAFSTEVLS